MNRLPAISGPDPVLRTLGVVALFTGLSAWYLHPLLGRMSTHLPVDTGDPALNAAVLGWNAMAVPLTAAWWNQPWFHPAIGVTALTENLLGLSPISTPVFWLSGNAVLAYNVVFFASWPLSALAMYFLVRRLTGRTDAGIVAGLAFAFAPFRATAELGHLQSLCGFGLPVALGAMHAYLGDQRLRWLVLLGVAWVMQSLSNGYYMLFGAVLIAMWLAYFGTAARTWRAAAHIAGALAVASLVLLPVLLGYRRIHEMYGLQRSFQEAVIFSARLDSWFQSPDILRIWSGILPSGQHPFFPGLAVIAIPALAIVVALSAGRAGATRTRSRIVLQRIMAVATITSLAGLAWYLAHGPWSLYSGDTVYFKMSDPYRAAAVLAICGIPLLWMAPVRDALVARRPMVFYTLAMVLMALLACGPIVRAGERVVLEYGPYRLLMWLPGFNGIRVTSRFWMMGVLCLSAAAGIAYASIAPKTRRFAQVAAGCLAAAAMLSDGWLKALPTREVPELWTSVPGADPQLPLLELPIGPGWDSIATLRSTTHGRRVFNGVSGYEPSHYLAMQEGLKARDPEMLKAMASLGAFEVSIEHKNDSNGRWREYVLGASNAAVVADDDSRAIVRVPATKWEDQPVGPALQIASVSSSEGEPAPLFDRQLDTAWGARQGGNEWLLADLSGIRQVGGVSLAIQKHPTGFPSRLVIEISTDGERFEQAWEGNGAARTFLAVVHTPTTGWLRIAFAPRAGRYVRVRQVAEVRNRWVVSELEINAAAAIAPAK